MKFTLFILTLSILVSADTNNKPAIQKTQEKMMTPAGRKEIIDTPEGEAASSQVQLLSAGNKEAEQEIWQLASELLPILAAKGENDPAKMLQYLEEMKKDPAKFISQFPPEQQQKLKKIAEKLKGKSKP